MEYRFFFFAGGEYNEREGNAFTDNFVSYLKDMLINRFSVIKGIYHSGPLINVIWALYHAQKPDKQPEKSRIIASSVHQIITDPLTANSQLTLISSSYGSVVAAQVACCLAERHLDENLLSQPFNIEAYANGLGICFPFLTRKFKGPSFLNKNPVSGHLHRVRALSVQKAKDFLRVIFVDYRLGGGSAKEMAVKRLGG